VPSSSTTPMRSPSPSNPIPRSALWALTSSMRSFMLCSSSGFASWFGNVPSGLQ